MRPDHHTVSALRKVLARQEPGGHPVAADLIALGAPALDSSLRGGLARGALHEFYALSGMNDAAAAAAFGLGLAVRAAQERPIIWIRQDFVDAETGWLYGAGLSDFGADPDRVVLVRVTDQQCGLRAAREALRCPALGAVLVEFWGSSRALDLTATRRLALAASHSGVTLVMIRLGAPPAPSAATSRWSIAAAPSRPLDANAPGNPAFAATLLRHRAGIASATWLVEWNCEHRSFNDPAPLSRPVVSVPARRPAGADRLAPERRTG